MRLLIRADASTTIGVGHVMRCLTLADVLSAGDTKVAFACRALPGNIIDTVGRRGYQVFDLPGTPLPDDQTAFADGSQALQQDVTATNTVLRSWRADRLLVDHYQLDAQWERSLVLPTSAQVCLDDLANRPHVAGILIDQTLGRATGDYIELLPASSKLLLGASFAMLRPQFRRARATSLQRRSGGLASLLVCMGGADAENATGAVLSVLAQQFRTLPQISRVDVVLGGRAPWLSDVKRAAARMPIATDVHSDVSDMAALMAAADLAIGGGGTTSWERCCLGLPSVAFCLASNQANVLAQLESRGALIVAKPMHDPAWRVELADILHRLHNDPRLLLAMSGHGSQLVDGLGALRVGAQAFDVTLDNDAFDVLTIEDG